MFVRCATKQEDGLPIKTQIACLKCGVLAKFVAFQHSQQIKRGLKAKKERQKLLIKNTKT